MPRTKEFDEAEVLDHALELFRARGFKATSFADLTAELGVSRQSLYDTYGDKEELFLAALKRYMDASVDCMKRRLADAGPVREVLKDIFEQLISQHCGKGSHGCLLVNTMVEMGPDAPARALAAEHARLIEGLFISRLCAAQRAGEIDREKDPVELARFFYHTLLGVAVAARAHDQKDVLRQTARLALKVLD
jgi:TetR/AcrR family transcriptional repressor of nem operon